MMRKDVLTKKNNFSNNISWRWSVSVARYYKEFEKNKTQGLESLCSKIPVLDTAEDKEMRRATT